jgi:sterol desaturase/sphingolipid hydroxylase (fatty acid hydroxylase superfamily)
VLSQTTEPLVVQPISRWVERRQVGLLHWVPLSPFLRAFATFVLMDYTLYLWHVLTHRVPFLWRMHIVHHIDRDLSLTTGLRFHAAELITSSLWRVLQVLLIGVTPRRLSHWQTITLVSVLFHHSNVRLPMWLERWLLWIVVTPRMHGIHHSIRRQETDSNWSSGLTLWDWLHGTLTPEVPQESLIIGVPAYRSNHDVAWPTQLALPFIRQRPSWG